MNGAYAHPEQYVPATGNARYRSTRGLAVTLAILFPLTALAWLAAGILTPTELIIEEGFVRQQQDGWGMLALPLFTAAAVVTVIWSFRVTANAALVGGPGTPSPGWALGSWFIPVAHAVLPFFPIKQAWIKSRAGGLGLLASWGVFWALTALLYWIKAIWAFVWGFGVGMDMVGQEAARYELPPSLYVSGIMFAGAALVAAVLFIPASLRLARVQDQMAAALRRQGRLI